MDNRTRTNLLMTGGILAVAAAFGFWGEHILLNLGLGTDGEFYARAVVWFPRYVADASFDTFLAKRVFPSAALHYALKICGIAPTIQNTIYAFEIYNGILLGLTALMWGLLADRLPLRHPVAAKWLGFCALFVNFCCLKFNLFYPTLTDTTALALGMLQFYFFMTERPVALACTTLAAAFTWPSALATGVLLLVFPRSSVPRRPFRWLHRAAALTIATAIAAVSVFSTWRCYVSPEIRDCAPLTEWLWLSCALLVAYLFAALAPLLNCRHLAEWPSVQRSRLWKIAAAVLLVIIVNWIAGAISNGVVPVTGLGMALVYSQRAVSKPLVFLLAHILYFGPIIIVAARFWGPLCRDVQDCGLGLTAVLGINVLLSIDSESRHLTLAFPMLVTFAVCSLDRMELPRSFYVWFVAASVLLSKVWLQMNAEPEKLQALDPEQALTWPWQRFMASWGFIMSKPVYWVQAAVVVLIAALLCALYFRRVERTQTAASVAQGSSVN